MLPLSGIIDAMPFRMAAVLFAAVALVNAQESPSADAILTQAQHQAAASHRAIWVIFHASW
jgi:hypothetical protein